MSAPEQPFSRAFCTLQGAGPCGIRAESWTCTTWAALLATMCAWFKACYNGRARCMPHSVDARQLNGKTSLCLHSCAQMYARDTQQNRACNLACIPVLSMGSQRVQHTARQIRTIDRPQLTRRAARAAGTQSTASASEASMTPCTSRAASLFTYTCTLSASTTAPANRNGRSGRGQAGAPAASRSRRAAAGHAGQALVPAFCARRRSSYAPGAGWGLRLRVRVTQQARRRRSRRPGAGVGLLHPLQVVVCAWRRVRQPCVRASRLQPGQAGPAC